MIFSFACFVLKTALVLNQFVEKKIAKRRSRRKTPKKVALKQMTGVEKVEEIEDKEIVEDEEIVTSKNEAICESNGEYRRRDENEDSEYGRRDESKDDGDKFGRGDENNGKRDDAVKEEFDDAVKEEFDEAVKEEFDEAVKEEFDEAVKEEFDEAVKKEFDEAVKEEFDDAVKEEFDDAVKEEFDDAVKEEFDDAVKEEFDDVVKEKFGREFEDEIDITMQHDVEMEAIRIEEAIQETAMIFYVEEFSVFSVESLLNGYIFMKIVSSDHIIVLQNQEVREFGSPYSILTNQDSYLLRLITYIAGHSTAQTILNQAMHTQTFN